MPTSNIYFKLPSNFIASWHTERYSPYIPTPTIPYVTYTSSLDTPTQHQSSSYNEEIQDVTHEEVVYHVQILK